MKPRTQCVLAHWMSGFRASGSMNAATPYPQDCEHRSGMNPAFLAL
jgi:hypothetical protein